MSHEAVERSSILATRGATHAMKYGGGALRPQLERTVTTKNTTLEHEMRHNDIVYTRWSATTYPLLCAYEFVPVQNEDTHVMGEGVRGVGTCKGPRSVTR